MRDETPGVLSVLNEPSIGLHPENITGLIGVMRDRFEERNSVVFVDHDISVIQTADQLIEIGPGSGAQGGYILSPGTPAAMSNDPQSAFGQLN